MVAENVAFFLRHGARDAAGYGTDFSLCVVANGAASPALTKALDEIEPRPRLVERPNEGGDFAAWGAGLAAAWDARMAACVFLNDTVRGPFLARYANSSWPSVFCGRLSARVKLVGPTVNRMTNWEPRFRSPHVQSMAFATDGAGIELLSAAKIFSPQPDRAALIASCGALNAGLRVPGEQEWKVAYVFEHEIRMSQLVGAAGYEIFGFQLAETTGKFPMDDVQIAYDGMPLNPVETIFVKASHAGHANTNPVLDRYTRWLDGTAPAKRKFKLGARRTGSAPGREL